MNDEPIKVAMAGDRNVLWGMAVTGRTALEHSSVPLDLHILGTGLTRRDEQALIRSWQHPMLAGVRFHAVETGSLKRFRSTGYLKSKAAYARYYLGRIAATGKLVYLDTDLLVLRDLKDAVTENLEGAAVGVVLDISTRTDGPNDTLRERLGLRDPAGYFNSGFLVIDLDRWHAMDAENALIRISIDQFDSLDSQDQDALNILMEGHAHIMDMGWNASQYESTPHGEGRIIHLIGTVKPWHPDYNYAFRDAFYGWLDKTAYAGRRPKQAGGLGKIVTRLSRRIPTSDMVLGKIRRSLSR